MNQGQAGPGGINGDIADDFANNLEGSVRFTCTGSTSEQRSADGSC
jgi:hypothetical protein